MPRFLTQEWLDDTRALGDQPEWRDLTATVQYVVTGGPDGDVKYYWVLEDGKLVDSQVGTRPEPDITFTLPYPDAVSLQQGELDPNVVFMQGRMKMAGDFGKLLQLLPVTKSPEYLDLQERIRSITDF